MSMSPPSRERVDVADLDTEMMIALASGVAPRLLAVDEEADEEEDLDEDDDEDWEDEDEGEEEDEAEDVLGWDDDDDDDDEDDVEEDEE